MLRTSSTNIRLHLCFAQNRWRRGACRAFSHYRSLDFVLCRMARNHTSAETGFRRRNWFLYLFFCLPFGLTHSSSDEAFLCTTSITLTILSDPPRSTRPKSIYYTACWVAQHEFHFAASETVSTLYGCHWRRPEWASLEANLGRRDLDEEVRPNRVRARSGGSYVRSYAHARRDRATR